MSTIEETESLVRSLRVTADPAFDARTLTDSFAAFAKAHGAKSVGQGRFSHEGRFPLQGRRIRYAIAATAAALAIGLTLAAVAFLGNGTAYAFTQTVKAMHSVRSLHMRFVHGGAMRSETGESWAEFDSAGQPIRCCFDYPQTEDGRKTVYCQDGRARVWFKDRNRFVTIADRFVARHMLDLAMNNDPKMLVWRLQEAQAKGQAEIATQKPSRPEEPIVLTVTHPAGSVQHDRRQILTVDPVTKLVTSVENCRQLDGQYSLLERFDILEYNRPIDSTIFSPQLPDGIVQIDQTAQQPGLPQGDMTSREAAQAVARQFFQALIDQDTAKVGALLSGLPQGQIREAFLGTLHVVRIVSIGEPTSGQASKGLRVAVTVEVENNGQVRQCTLEGVPVRRIEGDPARWQVAGGI
jgi:hypothetical protein